MVGDALVGKGPGNHRYPALVRLSWVFRLASDSLDMRFSLVLATVGRTRELARFLLGLRNQDYRSFELIIADQNSDDRLAPVLSKCPSETQIIHFHCERGLSRARNLALERARGEIVGFPDDDCWYFPDTLATVSKLLDNNPGWCGLTGMAIDEQGNPTMSRWSLLPGYIDTLNVWQRGISFSLFLRRHVIDSVGGFDPTLGLGSGTAWNSAEETDLLIRAISSGCNIYYEPRLKIGHPSEARSAVSVNRAYSYSMGVGRVLRMHRCPLWFVLQSFLRPLGGFLVSGLSLHPDQARFYLASLRGRLQGWLG